MAELLRMPEIAAATTTAVLSAWPVEEGGAFSEGDPIAVVETDKAEVEVTAGSDGVILKTLVPGGTEVEVGDPIALIGSAEEAGADVATLLAGLGVAVRPADEHVPALRRDVPPQSSTSSTPDQMSQPSSVAEVRANGRGSRIFASPLARIMARSVSLDLTTLTGTGPGGRIVRRDVEAASHGPRPSSTAEAALERLAAQPSLALPLPRGEQGFRDEPHSRMRKAIAARLTKSKSEAPHFYLRGTCRVDALLDLRTQMNHGRNVRISVNDLLVKAIAATHVLVPRANVIWTEDAIRHYDSVDVSVAIATDTGLVTPVLRGVERMSLTEISSTIRQFAERAKSGRLQPHELEGGSITITNLGMLGVEEFSAIINPPQSAILSVGATRTNPVVIDDVITKAEQLQVVLSVDHRPIDGALAAEWMRTFIEIVGNPLRMLI